MHIGRQEWQQLQALQAGTPLQDLYRQLHQPAPDAAARAAAATFLREEIQALADAPAELPQDPQQLLAWMEANTESVHARYGEYLQQRRDGAPRRFFRTRAHALYVLRAIAPTKLVDGAWLYGLLPHWRNPRLSDLVRTYVEELGEGALDKNHVALYRGLLARHALDPLDHLPDALYRQGLIQLALAWNAEEFLPEVIGFNLSYEQLPLHLLITAYELNELGIDPWYFTLHVTVDNGGTGHARRAVQATLDLLPQLADGGAFWQRVQYGARLACAGLGTTAVVEGFDEQAEVLRILGHKARAGCGAHSDYCKLAGRSVNDWLRTPQDTAAFLQQLQDAGWILRGQDPAQSRFWRLLQGERAEMFGVFSSYELQVLHDWIRGEAAGDGRHHEDGPDARRRPTFRAAQRHAAAVETPEGADLLDPDVSALQGQLKGLQGAGRTELLVRAMSPALHWTPAGLAATRMFWREATR